MNAPSIAARLFQSWLVALTAGCVAIATPPDRADAELGALRAALGQLPVSPAVGTQPLQVVDWRTGRPLPDAVVVEVPAPLRPSSADRDDADVVQRQRAWLRAALAGRRIALDARGSALVHGEPSTTVVIHADAFAIADSGCASPCPTLRLTVEVTDPDGNPLPGVGVGTGVTDGRGCATLSFDDRTLASQRHLLVAAAEYGNELIGGRPTVLPPGTTVVDTRSPDVATRPVRLTLPPTAQVEVRGVHDGAPAAYTGLAIYWQPPFARNYAWRRHPGAVFATLAGLPADVPVHIRQRDERPIVVTPRAGQRNVVEMNVRELLRGVRYRLTDARGAVLRGGWCYDGNYAHFPEQGEWWFPASDQSVFVRLIGTDGEEWSCAPFRLPDLPSPGVVDGGDLVLVPSSTTTFCEGIVLDRERQPVSTILWLTDGHGVFAQTTSDAAGRFRLCIGPWFDGPIGLGLPSVRCLAEREVRRGDRDVVVVVDPKAPEHSAIVGGLTGLPALAGFWPALRVRAFRSGEARECCSTGLSARGEFQLGVPPGVYDVHVSLPDGTPVLAAQGVSVGAHEIVSPANLRQSVPRSLRVATVRVVDAAGLPCPVPGLTRDATATFQSVVPVAGAWVELPQLLQRVYVRGDRTVVFDAAVVPVQVRGLPTGSRWHFGLRVAAQGFAAATAPARLGPGGAVLLVPRGVPLRCELLAQRYDDRGEGMASEPVGLAGFAGEFTVAAGGSAPAVFDAPTDLGAQLQALERMDE